MADYPTRVTVNSAIEAVVAAATGMTYTQDYDELTESIPDNPLSQVYWDMDGDAASQGSESQHITFGGSPAQEYVFNVDLYATPRAHIGEDMGKLLPLVDAVDAAFRTQAAESPPFGVERIQSFQWGPWERATLVYGEASYVGAQCKVRVRVF
jgi:hypothetical protein